MTIELPASDLLIAVGANIDPERNIRSAIELLRRAVSLLRVSTFYWSDPVGDVAQPRFINGAVRIATDLSPRDLKFQVLRGIESQLGRTRSADKFAPRPIDLDIAMLGERTINEPGLVIPDPGITTRAFLAVPLAELAPDWRLPGIGTSLKHIAAQLADLPLEPATELTNELKKEYLQ